MFCVESVHPDERDKVEYISGGSMHIDFARIEHLIRDQGSAAGKYFDPIRVDDQK